jgi:hypothetical protein
VDRPQRSASSIKVVDSTTKAVANMRKTSQNLEPIMGMGTNTREGFKIRRHPALPNRGGEEKDTQKEKMG